MSDQSSIYYHFCLLCTFNYSSIAPTSNSTAQPAQICAQAVRSILALAQSYEDLFTFSRLPAFLPYFVCAAGLYGLRMEKSGSTLTPFYLRRAKLSNPEVRLPDKVAGTSTSGGVDGGSRVKISVTAHAYLLLTKMASTNTVVRAAEEMLSRESQWAAFEASVSSL
ncbi:hypothetical protein NQ176_g1270 [Zarea fungicola]|uniref:Uncharacterized protein n=1 Tax=Zarea fungicola TaxID=93591 RepID=A0ACC1NUS5_9HYPO|nr:hypothetical protein NQ176_g1270 [Lecanicillium fungicola]